jgi:adenylate cyclase class 2
MKTEIEVKFLNIDIDEIRAKLKAAGAHLEQPMRLMRRALIEQPEHREERSFIRIRDQGDKVTLTLKKRSKGTSKIDDTQEIEVDVSNFEDTVELFRLTGWPPVTYQENRRETWVLGDAEVVIDEWPWLQPQIEIEAETEVSVQAAATKLGLQWEDAFYGHIDDAYQLEYTFKPGFRGVIELENVRFQDPVPEGFKGES